MKVVINDCFGCFGLSGKAIERYVELKGRTKPIYNGDIERNDPILVRVVEELGKEANGKGSILKIVGIPDDVDFEINGQDGNEWVAEKQRTWR